MIGFKHLCLSICLIGTLASCDKKVQTESTDSPVAVAAPSDKDAPAGTAFDRSIVFVNIDTLQEKYQFYTDAKKQLERKMESMDKSLGTKMEALYKRAGELEKKAQDMTRVQMEDAQKSLMAEEDNIRKSREQMEKSFIKEQETLDADLKKRINSYLAQLSKKEGYRYILSYTQAGLGMLYGDPSLDITNQVVKELNETYEQSKKK
jgi:outer membrane protein